MVKKRSATVAGTPPLLDVRNISFGYTKEPLMRDVALRVEAGEMLGLLGPNGSGKTTLLRLLSGLLRPQQGTILLEGRSLQAWGRRAIARRVAVVPQELQVPFAFTVEHMVGLGRTPFIDSFWGTLSKHDEIIMQDAMQASGVASLAARVFNELSGGEHQRVLIAMALAQQPAILLLDEPTAHLDLKYQIETLDLARQLNRERGVTIIAAMHDLNLAARYFPRLLLFQRGIVADASPTQVLDPALLSRIYGIDVQVGILRGARHLSILPPDNELNATDQSQEIQPRVHLLAGGGSGELLMRALADAHVPFSAGPLSIGDSDHVLARRLAHTVITEQPFAPISPTTLTQLRTTLAHTNLLILSPFPIGPGNLVLLQEAQAAVRRGMEVLLLAPRTTMHDTASLMKDYMNEEAMQMLVEMQEAGVHVVASLEEVMSIVGRYER